jgi:hypothetical protein
MFRTPRDPSMAPSIIVRMNTCIHNKYFDSESSFDINKKKNPYPLSMSR